MRPLKIISSPRAGRRIDCATSRGGGVVAAFPVTLLGLIVSVSMTSCEDAKADSWVGQSAQKMAPLGVDAAIQTHVSEASRRFHIPASWIWAVMHAESAGDVRARSKKGAMGLMQIMPATWSMLRDRQGLGNDPYDPRDNILAGAAYLRDLHDRYGARGFLAAYNAGPGRYEDHLTGRRSLPAETVDYVSTVGRRIDLGMAHNSAPSADERIAAQRSALFPPSMFASSAVQPMDEKRSNARSLADQLMDEERLTSRSQADQLRDEKQSTARSPADQSVDEERFTVPSQVHQPRDEERSFGGPSADPATREDRALSRSSIDRVAVDLSAIAPSSTGLFARVMSR